MSSGNIVSVGPGGLFVVEGAVTEAAVEDADEAVGQGSQRGVMRCAARALMVIEGPCAGAGVDSGVGPGVARVDEVLVADVAGQHDFGLARGSGDGRRAGVV